MRGLQQAAELPLFILAFCTRRHGHPPNNMQERINICLAFPLFIVFISVNIIKLNILLFIEQSTLKLRMVYWKTTRSCTIQVLLLLYEYLSEVVLVFFLCG